MWILKEQNYLQHLLKKKEVANKEHLKGLQERVENNKNIFV